MDTTVGGQVFCYTDGWMAAMVSGAEVSVAGLTGTTEWNGIFSIEEVPYGAHEMTIVPPSPSPCDTTHYPVTVTVPVSGPGTYMLDVD
jgi:hypothetical protein